MPTRLHRISFANLPRPAVQQPRLSLLTLNNLIEKTLLKQYHNTAAHCKLSGFKSNFAFFILNLSDYSGNFVARNACLSEISLLQEV
jgi:hypothetical protein